ncbi:hypothetical protein STEG23_022654, partial [Scotinomys teguina]
SMEQSVPSSPFQKQLRTPSDGKVQDSTVFLQSGMVHTDAFPLNGFSTNSFRMSSSGCVIGGNKLDNVD